MKKCQLVLNSYWYHCCNLSETSLNKDVNRRHTKKSLFCSNCLIEPRGTIYTLVTLAVSIHHISSTNTNWKISSLLLSYCLILSSPLHSTPPLSFHFHPSFVGHLVHLLDLRVTVFSLIRKINVLVSNIFIENAAVHNRVGADFNNMQPLEFKCWYQKLNSAAWTCSSYAGTHTPLIAVIALVCALVTWSAITPDNCINKIITLSLLLWLSLQLPSVL